MRGKSPVHWLLEEYHRTDRLPECLQLLFDDGAVLDDEVLRPVLLNDADEVKSQLANDLSIVNH